MTEAISGAAMRCRTMERGIVDVEGQRFGMLVVRCFSGINNRRAMWSCLCDCGKEAVKAGALLRNGTVKSCGCQKTEAMRAARRKSGARRSEDKELRRFYAAWVGMKARCRNSKHQDFKYYGARGIDVCNEWNEFERFKADMWPRPLGMTLDRIDNDKGYCRENCRWATHAEQRANQRRCA